MVNTASVIDIIGLERKRSSGNFKSSLKNVVRNDVSRGMTESSREYIAQKTKEQLSGIAPTVNTDISAIRDNVLHLNNIIAKNTADRIVSVTNTTDALEAEEDRLGKLGHSAGGAGLDTFGVLMIHPTKSGGATWFSSNWNTNPRSISQGNVDPHESRFWSGSTNPNNTPINITGDGTGLAYFDQANTEVWFGVTDAWLNTEMTMNIYIDESDTTTSQIDVVSRARSGNCNFAGYVVRYKDADKRSYFTVWPLNFLEKAMDDHGIPSGLPRNQWIGLKVVCRTLTAAADVKVEWYINYDVDNQTLSAWVRLDEDNVTGSESVPDEWAQHTDVINCSGSGDGTADLILADNGQAYVKLVAGNHVWWMIHNTGKVFLRHASIREIDPLP